MANIKPVKKKVLWRRVPTNGIQTIPNVMGENIRKLPAIDKSHVRTLYMFVNPEIPGDFLYS
jgi:hypothetical protein